MRISDWSSDVCSSDLKYADLEEFLKEFQLRLPPWGKLVPKDFRNLLEKIRERPDAALLESVILRSQSLAVYAPENIGHFGLALAAYAHFTSPIRRHPDLPVHRAITHALTGKRVDQYVYTPPQMSALSLHCSERISEEHTSELQSLMRNSYAVFCLNT